MTALFPEELLIGRPWRAATIGGGFAVRNPATGEVITSVADADDHADGNRHHAPEDQSEAPPTARSPNLERPAQRSNTGWERDVQQQARRDGGKTGNDDPFVVFYDDVPRALAEEALRKERSQSATPGQSPWPLESWPAVPTRFVLCSEDRFFPPEFKRRVVADRLAMTADEIPAGHCVALSRTKELAGMLVGYLATVGVERR